MKKILLLTVTAGEGHNSIAKAIKSGLEQNPENEIMTVDLFKEYATKRKVDFINDGYTMACRLVPDLYNLVFKVLQRRDPDKRNTAAAQGTVINETPKLLKTIYKFKPDIIICTHFYAGMIITNLRKLYTIPATVIGVLFDYTVHPFFECAIGVDYLITPSDDFNKTLIKKGYKESQLKSFGLPVRMEFSEFIDKFDARKKLGFDENMFTVMVMLGGGGFGGNDRILKKLLSVKTPIQIAMINGKDQKSKEKIDNLMKRKKTIHKVHNYGFSNQIDLIMSSADCLVGKCGGVSVNESLNKDLPMILNSKLVQQEHDNMEYLTKNGASIHVTNKHKLNDIIQEISQNSGILEMLKTNIAKIKKPNAVKNICAFCQNSKLANYNDICEIKENDKIIIKKIKKQLKK